MENQSPIFSEEQIAALAQLGIGEEELAQIMREAQRGEEMAFNTPNPQMRQAGRVAMAANPLEFIGANAMRYVGDKRMRAADSMYRNKLGQQAATRQGIMGMLNSGTPGPQMSPVPGMQTEEAARADMLRRLQGG